MNRRQFLGQMVAGIGAANAFTRPWGKPGAGGPTDEAWWETNCRSQFDGLALFRSTTDGKHRDDRLYFNTAALGISPRRVHERVYASMRFLDGEPRTAKHERYPGGEAIVTGQVEEGREVDRRDGALPEWDAHKRTVVEWLGFTPDEIASGGIETRVALLRNCTEGINVIANGYPIESNHLVVMTTQEHVSQLIAWSWRRERSDRLFAIERFRPDPDPAVTLRNLQALLDAHPGKRIILSLSHVTCTGIRLPLAQIGALARATGRLDYFFVDGAQAFGMVPVDVRAIGCDAYAASGHKWLSGPKGTGYLYLSEESLEKISPVAVGAYSATIDEGTLALRLSETKQGRPRALRYEYGTVNASLVQGGAEAFAFWNGLAQRAGVPRAALIEGRVRQLVQALLDGIQRTNLSQKIEVLTRASQPDTGIVLLRKRGVENAYGTLVGPLNGQRCRTRFVYEDKLNAARVSLHAYNSLREVDALLEALDAI